jgi:uncharacterized Rmd1/YagE family protein
LLTLVYVFLSSFVFFSSYIIFICLFVVLGILSKKTPNGRVFYFEMGSIVCWGCSPEQEQQLLIELEPFLAGDRAKTTETFAFDYAMENRVCFNFLFLVLLLFLHFLL